MLRLEHALIPWNRYLIMPVFALANAGVALGSGAARSVVAPVSLGVICGLVIGKPIGIVLFHGWLYGLGWLGCWMILAGVRLLELEGSVASDSPCHCSSPISPSARHPRSRQRRWVFCWLRLSPVLRARLFSSNDARLLMSHFIPATGH